MINPFKLINIIIIIVALISIGYFAKKVKIAKKQDSKVLNNIIIYLTLPALIFTSITKASISIDLIEIPIIAIITMLLLLVLAYLIAKKMNFNSKLLGSFLLVAVIGNTGYLGYPLAKQLAANQGLAKAIFYDIFGTVILILTIGLFIAETFGDKNIKTNKLKEIIIFPPFIGLIAAFALKPFPLPGLVTSILATLGVITIPLTMISIGFSLELSKIKNYKIPIALALFFKLLISPAIALILCKLFSFKPAFTLIIVMEAAMPSAMLSLVFSLKYDLDTEFIASTIFCLTIASAITVPLILIIFL